MSELRALVVDDEPDLRELLDMTLTRMGLDVDTAEDLSSARRLLANGTDYALCLTDMRLPDGNGLSLIKEISRDHPNLPVAMITAYGKVDDAVTALKYGAFDFVSKPVDLEVLRNMVRTALKLREDDTEQQASKPDEQKPAEHSTAGTPRGESLLRQRLVGRSQAMDRVRQTITKLARSQAPVLVSGESGTGKELAARLIHDLGPRAEKPFVAVNCGAIPSELMESEFFGHMKGSFTGADTDKEGLFQAANRGTLFLDEVADLPLNMQVKLLRVIQEKTVRPIGGREELKIDVRILSATHKPLKPLVESGDFRNDLYYRLNVIDLPMPSLRDRRGDIRLLAEHFLGVIGEQWGEPPRKLSTAAMDKLQNHKFSGNVRELVNILQRAVTLCEDDEITVEDLNIEQSVIEDEEVDVSPPQNRSLDDYMEDIEKRILEKALVDAKYNKTEAARQLGISFRSFRYKIKKYDID
ncbi:MULTISPECIES: sigma-54 dependent transcriptional regulator [unclassified Wenzhouxiangella]|uniref:sigma-54-dependent transcriptional regulator n=1 Tax=unclassified Wenzhouxiangella TaxID=2613841 RepID=UPI000E32BF72|nr:MULTISPECIES: sigma-54 dependent transcriptional regulator [unclassified Wenzhouxiangella]RFF28261.1 sigma-54-dependent Fis family transcriptional regulator [Wenzhouxiangella sp. 15181]RFP69381.1 sigma-54-dependent Fis family transcriptional regulator [Wenzhouxiangella sp. 15190]